MPMNAQSPITEAAALIRSSRFLTAFTGAGISVESGIPPFRGPGGLWNAYDPRMLELDYFLAHPDRAWPVIKEIFYDHFGQARPNAAHSVLAAWENEGWAASGAGSALRGATERGRAGLGATERGWAAPGAPGNSDAPGGRSCLRIIITQNIDNLHHAAGSRAVVEFHGSSRTLVCMKCRARREAEPSLLQSLPPHCPCGGIYKPDFIFFGEGIPAEALEASRRAAAQTDVMIVIGSTGEVYPAAGIPRQAAENGARIIEVNPEPSDFTSSITDLFIPMKAGEALVRLDREIRGASS